MADITYTVADVSFSESGSENSERWTKPAGEAIDAGEYVREDSNGKWVLGNATDAANVGTGKKGIAIASAIADQALTVVSRGLVDFGDSAFASQGIDDPIFLDDDDGVLADAAGTVSTIVGVITGVWINTTVRKVLFVNLS